MQNKQVSVIDIGSAKISVYVGERGINNTFVFKYDFSFDYDGFDSTEFYQKDKFIALINKIGKRLKNYFHGKIGTVYVGVPGSFSEVYVRDSQVSFSKNKKITERDIDLLFKKGYTDRSKSFKLINRSAIYFELGDFRRVANPIGLYSNMVKAKLSYVLCRKYLTECIEPYLKKAGASNVEFISVPLAESLYLIEPEERDRTAVILDVGYITSTLSIVQGDGIVFMKSFEFGGGFITADILSTFKLSFGSAEKIKRKINLASVIPDGDDVNILDEKKGKFYKLSELKNCVCGSLDKLCEAISKAIVESNLILPDYTGLLVTGGGISYIRGAKEHVAGRLNMSVNVLMPQVPLMKKPTMSSILSVFDLALEQYE